MSAEITEQGNCSHGSNGSGLPHHDAEQLTNGGHQAYIHLNNQIYTLRITKQGKLLLTK